MITTPHHKKKKNLWGIQLKNDVKGLSFIVIHFVSMTLIHLECSKNIFKYFFKLKF